MLKNIYQLNFIATINIILYGTCFNLISLSLAHLVFRIIGKVALLD